MSEMMPTVTLADIIVSACPACLAPSGERCVGVSSSVGAVVHRARLWQAVKDAEAARNAIERGEHRREEER
jgi:hypothetical protein